MLRVVSLFQTESYSERFPAFRTIHEENIFIPMDCYALSIPVIGDLAPDTDIFLDTVLKLIQLNSGYTVDKLKELMCADAELIRFIMTRLREKNFLGKQNEITEAGKNYLSNNQTGKVDDDKRISAYVFSRKDTGNLLAYVHTDQLYFERATQSGESLTLQFGSSGRPIKVEGRFLRERGGSRPQKRPTPSLLRKLISNYNRTCEQLSNYTSIPYRKDYMIDVSQDQSVIFHCKAVIQEGNSSKLLISDGFSLNCDALLQEILERYPELEKEIFGHAVRIDQSQENEPTEQASHQPQSRYGEIVRRFSPGQRTGDTVDAAAEANRYNNMSLRKLYEAVEWAFLYSCRQYPPSEQMLHFFENHTSSENETLLKSLLQKIGVVGEPPQNLLRQLNRGGIVRSLRNGVPELGTLLPLSIVAASDDRSHPLHRAFQEMPDALSFLFNLQNSARTIRHEVGADEVSELTLADFEDKTRQWIKLLLPDIQISESDQAQQPSGASQEKPYQRLNQSLQEELLLISPDKTPEELPPVSEFVFSLSRILEYLFRDYMRQDPSPTAGREKSEIINRIEKFFNVKIPDGIARVNPRYLESALTGQNATLNAYYVSVLLRCTETKKPEARALLEQDATQLIESISRLRGHTAEIALSYQIAELYPFRDATFKVIKTLSQL